MVDALEVEWCPVAYGEGLGGCFLELRLVALGGGAAVLACRPRRRMRSLRSALCLVRNSG